METEQTLNSEALKKDINTYLTSLKRKKEIGLNEIAQFFDMYMYLEKFEWKKDLVKIQNNFLKCIEKVNEDLSIYIKKNMPNILHKMKLGFQLLDIVVVPDTHLIAPVYESTKCEECENYIKEKRTCQLKRGAYIFGNDFNLQEKQYLKQHAISIFEETESKQIEKNTSFMKLIRKRVHNFLI